MPAVDVTFEDILPQLTPERVTEIVFCTMERLPDACPETFIGGYVPEDSQTRCCCSSWKLCLNVLSARSRNINTCGILGSNVGYTDDICRCWFRDAENSREGRTGKFSWI